MGGQGSGRKAVNRLNTSYHQLNVRSVQRLGGFDVGSQNSWVWKFEGQTVTWVQLTGTEGGVNVLYSYWTASDGWSRSKFFMKVAWTTCHYGGQRPYFLCPVKGCGRKMYILYGDRDVACRTCRRFSYQVQRISPQDRPLARLQLIRMRLGGSADIYEPFPERPVGMPLFAYTKLGLRAFRAERQANELVLEILGKPTPKGRGAKQSASNDGQNDAEHGGRDVEDN